MDREEATMATPIWDLIGVGDDPVAVFKAAGMTTVGHVYQFGTAQSIQSAIDALKLDVEEGTVKADPAFWKRLAARCCAILRRVRSAEAVPFTPAPFVCPISQACMEDPVMSRSGTSYDRASIEEWLDRHSTDPFTREPMTANDLVANRALKDAIEYYNTYEMRLSPSVRRTPINTITSKKSTLTHLGMLWLWYFCDYATRSTPQKLLPMLASRPCTHRTRPEA
jgi:U-box domain